MDLVTLVLYLMVDITLSLLFAIGGAVALWIVLWALLLILYGIEELWNRFKGKRQ